MAKPNPWNQSDAIALRTFIQANPRFLEELRNRIPSITGTTMEESAVTGRDANGFMVAIKTIGAMQDDPVQSGDSAGFISES